MDSTRITIPWPQRLLNLLDGITLPPRAIRMRSA